MTKQIDVLKEHASWFICNRGGLINRPNGPVLHRRSYNDAVKWIENWMRPQCVEIRETFLAR